MPRVVVAGSDNSSSFDVIDFTTPSAPTRVTVSPGFAGGCRVTLDGDRCFVGNALGGQVREVDVTTPAAPVQRGSITTVLSGIGALAVSGNRVAVGEWINTFQARVILLDFTNRNAPAIVGTAATPLTSLPSPDPMNPNPPAITSLAFLSPTLVVAAGSSDPEIVKVDFTNPAAPVITSFLSGFSAVTMDADSSRITAGDQTGAQVKLFNAATNGVIAGPFGTTLGGVTSLALAFPLALAGSVNDLRAVRITFAGSGGTITAFTPSAGGGFTTAIEDTLGACGEISGFGVSLIDLSTTPPPTLGSINTSLGSISTLSMKTFTVGPPPTPTIALSPASLAFGPVRVGSTRSLPLAITNTGSAPLTVSNLAAPTRFQLGIAGPLTIAPGATTPLTVTFAPIAETPSSGNITMMTNDPAHANVQAPVSGVGGRPHLTLTPSGAISFGNVAICQSSQVGATIVNSGALPLTVSSIAASGGGFTASPGNATVPPGGSQPVTLRFAPSLVGPASATLTVTSDDPTNPSLSRVLNGTGLPEPPPAIAVTPSPLDLGAVAVNFFAGRRIVVSNIGPCEDLHVSLVTTGPPFFVTIGDPTSVPPAGVPVTATIAAGNSARFAVVFAPTALGPAAGTLTLTSDAVNSPSLQVPLSGSGVSIAAASFELVLDRSGSMAAVAPVGTKIDALKAAVHLFADLMPIGQGESMGSVQFDDAFSVLTPFAAYDAAQRATIETDVDTLTPRNFTSIGGGIQLARAQLGAAGGRKVMIVFTDGLENTPPTIASEQSAVLAAGIESYAVGLGQPQNISTAALSQLATSSGGRFFQTDDTLILRKDFVEVLVDAFRQNMAADPVITLTPGQVQAVPVQITDCEQRVTFVLNWEDLASQIELEIVSPGGSIYTPASSATNQLVRYQARPGYRFYQIAFPPLDPGSGLAIGPARVGQWIMRLRAAALSRPQERCTTSVFVESDLTMRVAVAAIDPTQPVTVQATILHDQQVVRDAKVGLTIARPTRSLVQVQTPGVIARALDADRAPIPAGARSLIRRKLTKHQFKFDGEKSYRVKLPPFKLDGIYEFTVEAIGPACGGTFQRFSSQALHIGRQHDPRRTSISITEADQHRAVVRITPRDSSGSPLGALAISASSIRALGADVQSATNNGDGSLSVQVAWSGHQRQLTLEFNGDPLTVPLTTSRSPRKRTAKRRRQ